MSSTFTRADILKVALPLLASFLLEQVIGMTDAAFLGRVGEVELGASAIGGVAFITFLTLGLGFAYAAQATMGHALGEKRYARVGEIFGNAGLLLLGMGVAISVLVWVVGDQMMGVLCQSKDVAVASTDYIVWRSMGLPVAFAVGLLRSFYVATFKTRVITLSSIAMVLANVLFNYALIFGWGPIPAMGIKGAAIASALCEVVAFAVLLAFLFKKNQHKTFELFRHFKVNRTIQQQLLNMGIWVSLQEAVAFGTWMLFFVAVEHISPLALAASNVVRQLSSLIFMFIHAFGSATGSLGANLIGQGKPEAVKQLALAGLKLTSQFAIPVGLVILLGHTYILRIFTDIPEVLTHAVGPLFVMVAGYLFGVPSMFYTYVFSGVGANRVSGIASIVSSIAYVIYTQWIAITTMDTTWAWTADAFFYGATGVGILYYMRGDVWLKEAMSRRHAGAAH